MTWNETDVRVEIWASVATAPVQKNLTEDESEEDITKILGVIVLRR